MSLSSLLALASYPWPALAGGHITATSASVLTSPSPLCAFKRTLVIGFGPYGECKMITLQDPKLNYIYQDPFFKKGHSHWFWVDISFGERPLFKQLHWETDLGQFVLMWT